MLDIALFAALAAANPITCPLVLDDAWSPDAPPTARMRAAYGTLRNPGDRDLVVTSLASPDFGMVQLHESFNDDGVEKMRRIEPYTVAAGGSITLAPRGKHVMLMRPLHDIASGSTITVEIEVEGCDTPSRVEIPVRPRED